MQKRKAFDASRKRAEGNPELAAAQKHAHSQKQQKKQQAGGKGKSKGQDKGASAKWKAESEALRTAMRAGKAVSSALQGGGPMPEHVASAPDPSLVPCPVGSRNRLLICVCSLA